MRHLKTSLTALALACSLSLPTAIAEGGETKAKGLKLLEEEVYESLPERDPLMRGRLPEYVDLSNFFPKPQHQGNQGSCVGWAVGYALKTYQEAKEFSVPQPQEWDHFSPAFVFNAINQADNCEEGSYIKDALELIANVGAVRWQDFPYQPDQCLPPSEDIKAMAKDYSIQAYRRLQKDGMLFSIREALSQEKPVVIAMKTYESFDNWQGGANYRPGEDEFQTGFHAVTVVGYSEDRKALKIINSWGEDWGDNGFFWMDFRAVPQLIAEAYVTTDRKFDDVPDEEPAMMLAEVRDEGPGSTAAAATPPEPEPAPPEPVTEAMLASAITGHVGRNAEGQTPQGYDYYPASVWLNLEQPQLDQIAEVEWWFNHPTFFNPKRPVDDSNVFLATWKGYGCITDAEVRVRLKTGEQMRVGFDLCDIWDKFHPGGFRKDGTRSGTRPLAKDESFDKTSFEPDPLEDKDRVSNEEFRK